MEYRKQAAVILSLLAVFILACAPPQKTSLEPAEPGPTLLNKAPEQSSPAKAGWEVEWEKTINAGRKEGRVVVAATSQGPYLKEATNLIKSKYGLTLEIVTRRGGELMTTLLAERRAGIYNLDILITGTNTFFGETMPAGLADPIEPALILPEILDKKNWYGGDLHWGDKEHKSLHLYAYPSAQVAINTDLVKPDDLKSYYDILNPKWKGKIIMNDPTTSGAGLKGFSVLGFHILNLDFFRQLAKQEPMIIRDQRVQVNWMAQGKYSILFFPNPGNVTEFSEVGAPVGFARPNEGTYVSRNGGATTLVNRAAHPYAAKVMINWIFSKEGLYHISKLYGAQTARIDVSIEGIPPTMTRQSGIKYFLEADTEEWVSRDPEFKAAATEIFSPLIR